MSKEARNLVAAHIPRIAGAKRMLEPAAMAARLLKLLDDAARAPGITPAQLATHAESVAYAVVAGVALRDGVKPEATPPADPPRPGHARRVEDFVEDQAFGKGEA